MLYIAKYIERPIRATIMNDECMIFRVGNSKTFIDYVINNELNYIGISGFKR